MDTTVEGIDNLQKQQADIAARAREKYYALMSLLNEWEDLHGNANKSTPTLQGVISREVEEQHKDLLSLMRQWQDLQLQIETIVEKELQDIKQRATELKKITEQTTPPPEPEPDNDSDDDETRGLGIGA